MQLIDMFFDEIEDAKKRKVPFIIPIGTIEYHAHHASCGTDTMVINGVMRELEKEKEIARLEKQMKEAAKMMEYEYAAVLRDQIIELRGNGT